MKKIFFVAIAATLLAAGCQKTEVINQVNPVGGSSMTFAPDMGKLTKAPTAEGLGINNLKEQDFRLWAYYVEADPSRGADANTIYDKMENIAVTNDGDDWSTSPTHFWPGKGKKLKFFAVSADLDTYGAEKSVFTEGETTPTKIQIDANTNTITIHDFEVDNNEPDDDLMIADYVVGEQKNGDNGSNAVDLRFRHALAKVEFLFKNEMAKENDPNAVIVQHMYVDNIVKKGDVTIAEQSGPLTSNAWGLSAEKARFNGDYDGSSTNLPQSFSPAENLELYTGKSTDANYTEVPSTHAMLLTTTNQSYTTWLVIPQTVAESVADVNGLQVVIAYLIGERQFVATFPLFSTDAPAWNPNQYIKYNISLSPNMIGFNPTVEDWTPVVRDPKTDPETDQQGNKLPNNPSNDGQNIPIN